MTNHRARFTAIAAAPEDKIQLDEAALVIAAETDDQVDIDQGIKQLDDLADRFEKLKNPESRLGVSVSGLIAFIHEVEGFQGNVRDYYDPRNSYLNRVLENRCGIPISLALVHIAIGKRLGIDVQGINFPGHFLVRYGLSHPLIVDPFTGRILSQPDCVTLLRQIAGPKARFQPGFLDAAEPRDVLVRVLDNLKQIFWRAKDWQASQLCIERQLLLKPNQTSWSVQLGAVYEMMGHRDLAQHTYTHIVQQTDDEKLRQVAGNRLLAMQYKGPTLH